jgi:hypothetical protein
MTTEGLLRRTIVRKRSMRGMFTPAQNVSAHDASFDGRSRQKLTHTNEAREYQHVPMRPNNMPTEAKEFSCHTPRTEDAKPSSSRDTDHNTGE